MADNKQLSLRRTIEPSLLQGLVSCKKCGYALYRTSTRTSARKIHYYRCLGSDGWRYLGGSQCDSRPIRQDLLDSLVWTEVVKLLEDPTLINAELNRRLAAARATEPTRRRQETLERDLTRVTRGMERLVTAYQEDLVSLDELRSRMPDLRRREHVARAELKSIGERIADSTEYLRLAETLTAFLKRLRTTAHTLDIIERQRVVRLLVKEVLATDDSIVIRHSIPVQHRGEVPPPLLDGRDCSGGQSYLLRTGSHHATLRCAFVTDGHTTIFRYPCPEKTLDHALNSLVLDPVRHKLH